MRALLFSAVLLACAQPAAVLASDACDDPQDQITLNECANEAFTAADARLNADYREIRARLGDDPDGRNLFTDAQRAWIAFRDAECSFRASGVEGGSIYPMIYSDCVAALTTARIADFGTFLSCEEGDLSCPVPAAQ